MNEITLMFLLLWSSGSHLTSAVYVRSPEEVVVGNGTTGCGVPAIKPKVPGCPSDGLGIINGEEAVPHSWPWQVYLQHSAGWHRCGGSLISRYWIVTAAYCEISTSHRVILGLHNRKDTNNIQNIRIGKVFNHPYHNNTTHNYDIALIKLESPAQMNEHVSPVCVAETCDNFSAGMKCVTTGWGQTRYEPLEKPDKLQQVCMPLLTNNKCQSYWPRAIFNVTSQMICAGANGADICYGDSGSPLVCKKNGAWTLVGVTSWGMPDCPTNMPSGFVRVTELRAWMDRTIADN